MFSTMAVEKTVEILHMHVEKERHEIVFHISTGDLSTVPVEMWKTLS